MSEVVTKRPLNGAGINGRMGAIVALACTVLIALLIPSYGQAGTVTESFDGFTCSGTWQVDPSGPYTSYIRDCGNGWTAYAVDTANPIFNISAGSIGDQNVVDVDTTVNGPSTSSSSLASALLNTAPGNTPRGVIWLLKSYAVEPGVPLTTIQADARLKVLGDTKREYYSLVAFDGIITKPTSLLDVLTHLPTSNLLSGQADLDGDITRTGDACEGLAAGQWCRWQTFSIGGNYVIPKSGYITIGFNIQDIDDTEQVFGEFDNLTMNGIITTGDKSLPTNDLGQRWGVNYGAPGTDNSAEGSVVAMDSADPDFADGSVIAAGKVYTKHLAGDGVTVTNYDYDVVTTKYDSNGNVIWSKTYDGGSGDQPVAIAVNHDGALGTQSTYVLVRSYVLRVPGNITDPSNNNDYVVIKYDKDGNLLWHHDVPDSTTRDDVPTGLAVDSSGVYVTGSSCASATSCDFATTKLNIDTGSEVWTSNPLVYYGASYGSAYDLNKAIGVKLDSTGNVYVTGTGTGGSDNIVTVKYDSSGVKQWDKVYTAGGWDDRATAFAVDGAGNSYVAGVTYDGGSPSILVLKYKPNGDLQWAQKYSNGVETLPSAVAFDGSGNVYVTGKSGRVLDHDIVTVKFDSNTGAVQWDKTFGNAGLDDYGAGIAVGVDGDVYVTGTLTRGPGNTDIVLVKYDGSTGAGMSSLTYDGFTLNDTPAALAMGVDSQGDAVPVVVGKSFVTTGLSDMTTIRFEFTRPDLTVSSLSGPTTGVVGSTISVNDTVLNIEDIAAKKAKDSGAFKVGYYLADASSGTADLTPSHLIPLNVQRDISNLAPGESSSATTVITIPDNNSVVEGTYYLVVKADDVSGDPGSVGVVAEADETNNLVAASSTIVISANKPDLAITTFSSTSSSGITRDSPFEVNLTISNLTSVATSTVASSFHVGVYLSTDSNITTSDTPLQYVSGTPLTVTNVAGGGTYSMTTTLTVPSTGPGSVPAGTYYLGAIVDDSPATGGGAVPETNENNNTAVMSGASYSTLLTSNSDFVPGLSVSGTVQVGVAGLRNAARVILGQSSVVWTNNNAWKGPVYSYSSPALFDLNGDGLVDMMVGDLSGVVHGYANTGTATSPVWTSMSSQGWDVAAPSVTSCPGFNGTGSNTYAKPAIGDLNNDGTPDIMMVGYRYGICAYANTGSATNPVWTRQSAWDVPNNSPLNFSNNFPSPALGDLNGDGKPDLVIGSSGGKVYYVYQNTGTATAPQWTYNSAWNYTAGVALSSPSVSMVDLDRDGRLDMMIGFGNGGTQFIRNTGTTTSPSWTLTTSGNVSSKGSYADPAPADLNGDGKIDLLIGTSTQTAAVQNTGPYFANSTTGPDGTYLSKVIDSGTHGNFSYLSYIVDIPTNTNLLVDVRAGDVQDTTDASWTPWYQSIVSGSTGTDLGPLLGSKQWIQYRVRMFTTDINVTPSLYSIQAFAAPAPATAIPVSVVAGGGGGGGGLGLGELLGLGLAGLLGGARRLRRRVC